MNGPVDFRPTGAAADATPADAALPAQLDAARHDRWSISLIPGVVGLVDFLIMAISAIQAIKYFVILSDANRDQYLFAVVFIIFGSILLFHRAGLYEIDAIMRPLRYSDAVIAAVATSFLFFFSMIFALNVAETFSLTCLAAFAGFSIVGVVALRAAAYPLLRRLGRTGRLSRSLVVLGAGEQASRFLERIADVRPYFTDVVGVYADGVDPGGKVEGHPILGGADRLLRDVRAGLIDDVVVALPWNADKELVQTVERLKELPINVYISSDLIGFRLRFRQVLGADAQLSMFEVERRPIAGWSSLLKALEDYVLASVALILLSPILLLVALAIKIDDPDGPIFFMQKRLGFNNQVFEIYKFRSMYKNSGSAIEVKQATKNDPRVTRVGRIIRATSIDELPQLLNVLNGTMSLVGPRPHAISHNEEFGRQIRGYFSRHKVKPGITGWAQVNGLRGETETLDKMEARIRHDVYYAENWSLLFDLRILVTTVLVLFFQRSAY